MSNKDRRRNRRSHGSRKGRELKKLSPKDVPPPRSAANSQISAHSLSPNVKETRSRSPRKKVKENVNKEKTKEGDGKSYKPEKQIEAESREERRVEEEEHEERHEQLDTGPAMDSIRRCGFKVDKVLGTGSYAVVYKVSKIIPKENSIGNEQACKVIYTDDRVSNNYKTKFLPQEIDTLMKIKHESIVRIWQIVLMRQQSGYLIFMEYAAGGTLSDLIVKKGAQEERYAKDIFCDIFRAMGYMHSLSWAHRDMKLENILLDKNNRPKITDFSYGVNCGAKSDELVLSKTFCGTTPYMPPEMLQQKAYSPLLADVWSTGICLYIFVNAAFPFKISDDVETLAKLQMESSFAMKPKYDAILSAELKDLISQLLQVDPTKRIDMKRTLSHPWISNLVILRDKINPPKA